MEDQSALIKGGSPSKKLLASSALKQPVDGFASVGLKEINVEDEIAQAKT